MAVVSRVASLRIQNAAENGRHRTWVATAAVENTPAGGSVAVSVTRVIGFVGSPDPATTLELRFYNDSGALIRTVALDDAAAFPQSTTYHFTDTGASGGAARAGTIEIAIYARREPVAGTIVYEVETDATPNNPGAGNQSLLDRGWIRTLLDATVALSNVALGGAKTSPASHPDSLHVRVTVSAVLYVARAFTVGLSNTTPALSGATNSATSGNFDVTFSAAVHNRFPSALGTTATTLTPPNSTLTGLPFVVLTTTNDSMSVDPRVSLPHRFQIDQSTWAGAEVASGSRSGGQFGFLGVTALNARGEGVNGLSVTDKLWDSATLVGDEAAPVKTATNTTRTILGAAGRTGTTVGDKLPIAWDNQLPRGAWTAKATLNGSTVAGLELDNTRTLALTGEPDALDAFGLAMSGVLTLK